VTSALGIGFSSVCFLSVFKNVYFPWCGLLFFISLVLSQCAQLSAEGAGVLPSSPTFGPGRQTGAG